MTLRTAPTVPVRTRRTIDPVDRTRRIRGRRRMRTADAMIALVWASVAAAVTLWLAYGGLNTVSDLGTALTAAGIVTGLVGTDLILVMLVLAARIPAIDRVVDQAGL